MKRKTALAILCALAMLILAGCARQINAEQSGDVVSSTGTVNHNTDGAEHADTEMKQLFSGGGVTVEIPAAYADLIVTDEIGSDNLYNNAVNVYYASEHYESDDYTPMASGGWMFTLSSTLPTAAHAPFDNCLVTPTHWTADGEYVYLELVPAEGAYHCADESKAEFEKILRSIVVNYGDLPAYTD